VQATNLGEIHITITGLSTQSVNAVFNKLEALDQKEIVSDKK
jgi:hypothetical protein